MVGSASVTTAADASTFYRATVLELSEHAMKTYGPAVQERVDSLVKKVVAGFPLEGVDDDEPPAEG